jgi:hypothetical protein
MSFAMKYAQRKILRRIGLFRLFIGMGALCMASLSCIKPLTPEEFTKESCGGYKVVAKLQTAGYSQDVIAIDTCAYLARGQGLLAIVNIKDPQRPQLLSELLYQNNIQGYSKRLAYTKTSAGTETVYSADGPFGIAIVDVTDKFHPKTINKNNGYKPTIGLCVCNNILLSMTSADGIWFSDISNPKKINPINQIQVPGYAESICMSSDSSYALVAIGEGGFIMNNFSLYKKGMTALDNATVIYIKNNSHLMGRFDLPGFAEDIAAQSGTNYAFLACGPAGLQIVDYSDTSDIKLAGSFATGGYAKAVRVTGDRAYLATEAEGVQIIDISNVASPRLIGKVKVSDVWGIDVSNGYVYAADRQEGLIIIKIP